MTEEQIFKQLELYRSRTVKWIEAVDPAIVGIQPVNFNNTIHWHIGHILLVQDRLTLLFSGQEMILPEEYQGWFGNGTKPADWVTAPPTFEVLLQQLKEQPARLQQYLSGNLTAKLTVAFLDMETVEESLNYTFYHEGIHLGCLMAIKRAIEANKV